MAIRIVIRPSKIPFTNGEDKQRELFSKSKRLKPFLTHSMAIIALSALFNGRFVLNWLPVPDGTALVTWALLAYLSTAISGVTSVSFVLRRTEFLYVTLVVSYTVFLCASLMWTPSPVYGLMKVQAFILLALTPTLLVFLFGRFLLREDKARTLARWHMICGLVYAAAVLSTYIPGMYRATAFGVDPIRGSEYLMVSLMTVILLSTFRASAFVRSLYTVSALILITAAVLGGSRGPVLAAVPSLMFMFYWLRFRRVRSLSRVLRLCVHVFILVAGLLLAALMLTWTEVNLPLFTRISLEYMMRDPNVRGRLEMWRIAYESAAASNPLLGTGVGGFSQSWLGRDWRSYPHNILLETLSENGIIGLTILIAQFCLVAYAAVFRLKRARRSGDSRLYGFGVTFTALFLFATLNAMTTGDLRENSEIWFYGTLALLYTGALGARPADQRRTGHE